MKLEDRTVVITGGSGNLGLATAAAAESLGARVHLIDIAIPDNEAADRLRATRHKLDLLDSEAASKGIQAIGRIDALCNIAGGFGMGTMIHETTDDEWDHLFNLNVRTLLNASRAAVPGMMSAGRGKIVNVAAASANSGVALMGPYIASKSVVMRLTETMDEELKGSGINVNCVMPSIIDTPQNRAGMPDADFSTWVSPAQLAEVICFLISDDAIAIHGACVPVRNIA